jgi:HK97 family phage prohead protease
MPDRPEISRTMPLLDYEIDRSGDGRVVVAYAATFNLPYEVHDQDGHYDEVIHPGAFNKVLARSGFLSSVQVHFNHGLTLWGTPSDRYSMPLGVPEEIRADGRGLLTRTRYAKTELGDEVLELWQSGAIRAQSFRGPVLEAPRPRPGDNGRPVIVRYALGLREYGPTPNPANADAGLVAIRSQLLAQVGEMTPEQRRELASLLADEFGTTDPHVVPDADPDIPSPAGSPDPGLSLEALSLANANRRRRTV